MNSAPIRIETSEDEDLIVKLMMRAVAQYIKEKNLNTDNLSKTKLQKVLCQTVDDLDLPITRSWYMRGEYIPNPIINKSDLPNYYNGNNNLHLNTQNREIYRTLYSSISKSMDELWFMDINELLSRHYSQKAPERYKRLYIENNILLTTNKAVKESQNKNLTSLLNWSNAINYSYYCQASKSISKIHVEMASKQEFEGIIDNYISLTDLFEGIYLRLDILYSSNSRLPRKVKDFLIKFDDIYYYEIWKYPALIVSKNTMKGIRKKECIALCEDNLKSANEKMEATIENVGEKADDLGLVPTSTDLESADRELYTQNENNSRQFMELWNIYNKV